MENSEMKRFYRVKVGRKAVVQMSDADINALAEFEKQSKLAAAGLWDDRAYRESRQEEYGPNVETKLLSARMPSNTISMVTNKLARMSGGPGGGFHTGFASGRAPSPPSKSGEAYLITAAKHAMRSASKVESAFSRIDQNSVAESLGPKARALLQKAGRAAGLIRKRAQNLLRAVEKDG
jgi:hypothetical protein